MADLRDFAEAELMARQNPAVDVGVQVRPTRENVAALDRFRGEVQRDFNWRNTFGQIPPADVLRETRDMIALTNRAIEQRMRLAAQTDREAQGIYIKDAEFQEWQRQAPLRDELLKSQIERREALTARDADRQIWENRKEAAQARYDMALESFMRDKPEATTDDVNRFTHEFATRDSDARSIPAIRAAWTEMNQRIRQERGIAAGDTRQEDRQTFQSGERVAGQEYRKGERVAGQEFRAGESEKTRQQRAGEQLQRERELAKRHVETAQRLRQAAGKAGSADEKAYADKRVTEAEAELSDIESRMQPATAAPAGNGDVLGETVQTSPMEGQRVKQKSTGKTGVIRNGEFIPDAS